MEEHEGSPVTSGNTAENTDEERLTTKVFFTQALDKATHRQIIHKRVQELINEDSEDGAIYPEVIYLAQCGWEAVGQVFSPTYFAMNLCRKYNLLPSERSVLLPLSDQYQAIQLCLANINKKKHGDFTAAVSDVLDVWNELYRDTVTSCNETFGSLTIACNMDEDSVDLNLPSSRRESYDPVVREMQEIVTSYKEFLESSGCVDYFMVYALLREHLKSNEELMAHINSKVYIIEGISHLPTMERELLKLLLSNAQILKITVALPLDESSSSNDLNMSGIGEDNLNTSHVMDGPKDDQANEMDKSLQDPASDMIPSLETEDLDTTFCDYVEGIQKSSGLTDFSESELYVEQLILAHLRLLINTRDELALAVLCSMPGREITAQGFHDIKTEAQKKNMPLYPTILSFVMRLRLGGKGYQADPNCPLLCYSKPLGEFVDSIMKLQNVVEEESDPGKAAAKVLSLIKTGLMRIRGRALKGSCIERVWDCLCSAFTKLTSVPEESSVSKESDVSSKTQQTTAALRPCLKLLMQLCDEASGRTAEEIVDVLCENFLTQCNSSNKMATPIRIPTVLSLFRSPIDRSPTPNFNKVDDEIEDGLRIRLMKKKGLTPDIATDPRLPIVGSSTPNVNKVDDEIEDSLRVRLMKKKGLTPDIAIGPRFQSGCSRAPDDLSPVRKGDVIHDTTLSPIVGPTLKAVGSTRKSSQHWKEIVDYVAKEEERKSIENATLFKKENNSKMSKEMKTEEKRSKRSLLSDISNIVSDSANKKSKSCNKKGKTMPLIKGQRSITSFFKV